MPRKKKSETEKAEEKKEEVFDIFSAAPLEAEKIEEKEIKAEEVKEEVKRKITKKELEERAKKLAEKIEEKEIKVEEVKEKFREEKEKAKEKAKTLVPIEDYVKYGIHIGTKVMTPHIRPFIYRRRADGIAIIDTNKIDGKLKEAIDFLVKYNPEDFIVVCKREAGWKALEKFSEVTGVRIFTKKYPAGIVTNIKLPSFFEVKLVVICDPWLDKNAMHDAKKMKKKVMAICDTNNYTFDVDVIIPANNKSNKSLGLVFYILAREYLKAKKIDRKLPSVEEFIGEKVV